MKDKFIVALAICMFLVMIICASAWSGEKEEREYEIAYWQEHIKALQMDFDLSQIKLKEAIVKKQAFEEKQKEKSEKDKK